MTQHYTCGWCGRVGWDPTTLWRTAKGHCYQTRQEANIYIRPDEEATPVYICYDCGMQVRLT